jgi:inosine-uridine nucleoside N-ribohydrolase
MAPIPVIIDTDPGVDDVIAILLALASPELEIIAFILSFGNIDLEATYENILKIYQAISIHNQRHPEDKQRFPIYMSKRPFVVRGAAEPLAGDIHGAQHFHGRDGLGDIRDRHPDLNLKLSTEDLPIQITDRPGAEVVLDLIRAYPSRSITYIALGPLTNLAQVMQLDSMTFRERIGRVVCMGGALDVPGNSNPVAEFNFFADPFAVKQVLFPPHPETGIPLDRFILLPLDITTPHELSFPYYKERVDPSFESSASSSVGTEKAPLTHFTSSFLERTREIMLECGKDAMELHDIVAVWCAIENPPDGDGNISGIPRLEKGWKATKREFDIERTGEITRGMLVVDRRDEQNTCTPDANSNSGVEQHIETQVSATVPARVEVEHLEDTRVKGRGVTCIIKTPGLEALLKMMLERVWGVSE